MSFSNYLIMYDCVIFGVNMVEKVTLATTRKRIGIKKPFTLNRSERSTITDFG